MYSITMNVGDSFTIGGNTVVQLDRANNGRIHLTIDAPKNVKIVRGEKPEGTEDLQARLEHMAKEIDTGISAMGAVRSKELISAFVSELFLSLARQSQKEERRQKQAEGIAAARAKGVKFGRARKSLPENFYQVYQDWRDGKMVLREAADACGMAPTTFHDKAIAYEQVRGG